MYKAVLNVIRAFPAAAIALSMILVACGGSDCASGVQTNGSAEVVSSSEMSNIESSSSDLEIPSSRNMFGGSSALDSPEGSSTGVESTALPVSSEQRANELPSASESSSSVSVLNLQESSAAERSSSSVISSTSGVQRVALDKDGFATVADVYNSLLPEEKAVFVIRHSEREDAVTIETELTANGIKMAQDLGKSIKSDEEFSYITSGFVRTNETANNISKGRGESSLPKLITNYDITGNWFLKISADSLAKHANSLGLKGSSIELMARWAYEGGYPEVFYELERRAEEFIQTVVLKNLPKWKRVSIMVSHDIFVMPLTVFGSQRNVALMYHEDYHWINYIAGVAIIVGVDNNIRYVPIKGTDSGIIDYLAIYMKRSP